MTETSLTRREQQFLILILSLIVVFVGMDLITDSKEGAHLFHLIIELSVALGASFGIFLMLRNSLYKTHALVQSRELILEKEKEAEKWKMESQKYIQGLSLAIDAQLERWRLSPSEKEVALLILKGLSLKEISDIRQTAEKTVRTQSAAIYSKSGLSGRSELAAFFLEDLLVPSTLTEKIP